MLKCITDPLVRVAEAMQWFMTATEIRLVHIVTSEPLRLSVLEHVAAMEHFATNRAPFVILEAPVESNDDGWETRSEELRDDMADLRTSPPQPPSPTSLRCVERGVGGVRSGRGGEVRAAELESSAGGVRSELESSAGGVKSLGGFALTLKAATECLDEPLGGLIVVLSPFWVRDQGRWLEDVKALSQWPTLARVRWVVVDIDEPICKSIADEFGTCGLVVDARVVDPALAEDMATLTALAESAPDGAMGMRLAGCAGPDVAPPPRKDRPRPLTPDEARAMADKHNVPAESLMVEPMQQLRELVLGAGTAMAHGDAACAVGSMREARDAARCAGLERVSILMTLMMGGYAMQGSAPETAAKIFEDARMAAENAKMPDLEAQAQLSIAAGLFAANKHAEAALAYCQAGQCAAAADMGLFAIEAYRMSGELLAKEKDFEHAAQAFSRACEIANDEQPLQRHSSSASEAARALAALLRDHGLIDAAEHLERVAGEIEMNIQDEHTNVGSEALHVG